MRTIAAVSVLVACLALAPSAGAATKRCRDVIDVGPTGMDPADGNRVRATKVSCLTARRVVRRFTRWVFEDDDGRAPIYHGPWACYDYGSRRLGNVCKASGGRRVRWMLGP